MKKGQPLPVIWESRYDIKDKRWYFVPLCGKCKTSLENETGLGFLDKCPSCETRAWYHQKFLLE